MRDAGNLLSRAGFALPGVDVDEYVVKYQSGKNFLILLWCLFSKNGTFRTKINCWFTNSVVNELVLTKTPFIVYELQASNEFKASSFWFHVTMMFHLLSLFNIVVGARLSFPWIIKNNAGKLIHRCSQAPAIYFHKRGRVSNSVGEGQHNFLMKYYQRKWHKTHSSV